MSYLDLTERILMDGECNDTKYDITHEELADFHNFLLIDEMYLRTFNAIEVASEFFKACPLFTNVFAASKREELFYAEKNKFFMHGVSSKFVYLFKKSYGIHDTPNVALSMLRAFDVTNLLINRTPPSIKPYDVLCNIIGDSFNIIKSTKRKVKVKDDVYELYIPNTDRVAVIKSDIAELLQSTEDINNVVYTNGVGLTLYDKPLRCMGGHFGITTDDYDLRGCT